MDDNITETKPVTYVLKINLPLDDYTEYKITIKVIINFIYKR